ncbi:MAG: hypothetical protein GTO18_06625 [Anaerolineales bacterium]|nr:hypothetical protein [Anaerolineales bacterium]
MTTQADVMLVGLGDLGGIVLEFLARVEGVESILVGSRNVQRGEARCKLSQLSALAGGHDPDIQFVTLDLHQVDATAEIIAAANPKIILCTASMMTWWLADLLPEGATSLKQASFGAWLPVHLTLPMKLMQALQIANYEGFSLIAPYPDVVNAVLKGIGLTPTAGIGNLDEVVLKLQLLGSRKLATEPMNLRTHLIAHHALQDWVFGDREGEPPPFYLKMEHRGEDVSERIHDGELLFTPYPLPDGPAWNFLSAASAVRLIRALLSTEEMHLHAPGPSGLPGGYPIRASKQGVTLDIPPELSFEQAVSINDRSHAYDGIDRVESDGTVVFRAETVDIMRQTLGYDCERLEPDDAEWRARELIDRFMEYARGHGVELPLSER